MSAEATFEAAFGDMCDALRLPSVPRVVLTDWPHRGHGAAEDPRVPALADGGWTPLRTLDFVREFVGASRPAILKVLPPLKAPATASSDGGVPANTNSRDGAAWMAAWASNRYLASRVDASGVPVTVALTPNGRADAVATVTHVGIAPTDAAEGGHSSPSIRREVQTERFFASAAETKMSMAAFFELLAAALPRKAETVQPKSALGRAVDISAAPSALPVIPYVQLQNGSLTAEFGATLRDDVPSYVRDLGAALFGSPPDAENLWIGSSLSLSTMHQDWYENLYWVVRGQKVFTLVPPWESRLLARARCRPARYQYSSSSEGDDPAGRAHTLQPFMAVDADNVCDGGDGMVEWIVTDVAEGRGRRDGVPGVHPVEAVVGPDEVLYLPAMWFHAVAQQEDDSRTKGPEHQAPHSATDDDKPSLLSPAAAAVPCVVAVNYWFDMNCNSPLFWIQDALRKVDPRAA